MRNKYWFTFVLLIATTKLWGQETKVNNSFIIVINNKLITTVEGLRLTLSDTTGGKDFVNGGYYPGVLYVNNIETKDILYADSTKILTLSFDCYEYGRDNKFIHTYNVKIDKHWLKQSFIIVRIFDVDKKRKTYKYSFEIPGYSFAK